MTIKLKSTYEGHYLLDLNINGKPAHLLLDTGSTATCVHIGLAENYDLKVEDLEIFATGAGENQIKTKFSRNVEVTSGDKKLTIPQIALIDLGMVNKSMQSQGENPIDGILGADALNLSKAIIDYGEHTFDLALDQLSTLPSCN